MKIAVVGTRGFPGVQGGVEMHCEQLYTHLVERGCDIIVFTRKPYVDPNIRMYKGISLIPISCPKNKFLEAIIHTFISVLKAQKLKPDLLHVHAIGPSLFVPLARLLGMKVVVTNHGENYKHMKWGFFSKLFLRFCEAMGMIFSNNIIAISRQIASVVEKKYNKSPVVIPNGVVMPEILQSDKTLKKYGLAKGKYILSVGRFVPEKGFHDLVDAFNKLTTTNSHLLTEKWKLVIVGRADHEDKYSSDLKIMAGRNSNIVLTGFLTGEPLQELYSHAGLFVLPSYYEGWSIALLEALSYGLSCIASDIPSNRNMVSTTRLFAAGNVKALAGAIREFKGKPLSKEEKNAQRRMVSERYDWGKIADRTIEVYNQNLAPTRNKTL